MRINKLHGNFSSCAPLTGAKLPLLLSQLLLAEPLPLVHHFVWNVKNRQTLRPHLTCAVALLLTLSMHIVRRSVAAGGADQALIAFGNKAKAYAQAQNWPKDRFLLVRPFHEFNGKPCKTPSVVVIKLQLMRCAARSCIGTVRTVSG